MSTESVIYEELSSRISNMKIFLEEAEDCLSRRDLFQCAARMQSAGAEAVFDNFTMDILCSIRKSD